MRTIILSILAAALCAQDATPPAHHAPPPPTAAQLAHWAKQEKAFDAQRHGRHLLFQPEYEAVRAWKLLHRKMGPFPAWALTDPDVR